jgi:hypothetical protein
MNFRNSGEIPDRLAVQMRSKTVFLFWWYNKSMDDKTAIEILMKLLEKNSLSEKEKKAVLVAIGILSWSKLAEGRIQSLKKAQKAKRDRSAKW